jgi:crotonobetaine/carnitine-CoA ligase
MSNNSANVIGKLIEEKARRHQERTFLYFHDEQVSYGLLDRRSNQFGHGLATLGIQKDDKVAVMMENHPNNLYTWLGVVKLGAVEVPINTAYKGDLLQHVINNSQSKVLVIDGDLLNRLLLIQDQLTDVEHIVCHGPIDEAVATTLPAPVSSLEVWFENSPDPIEVEIRPGDPAGIIYTSGTTGLSKGVVGSHNYFLHTARLLAHLRYARSDDVIYTFLPLFHVNAKLMAVTAALVADAQIVLRERFSASAFWDDVRTYGVTQFNYLGAVMTILSKQEPKPDDADNPVRLALGPGCPPDVMQHLEQRYGFTCLEGFGMSEIGIVIHQDIHNRKIGACGKVLDDLFEVKLVDDDDEEVAAGAIGEIVVRPKKPYIMMSEYYRMPEKTLEAFRNLWFHTGDYARQDEQGFFYFVDRKKDAIRRRGENISSFEVEKILNSHPKILETAVFAVPSELGEDEVKANVVLKPGETLSPEELINFCNERMAYFAIPRYVEFVAELPKTPTNRVEKYRLRQIGLTDKTWDREKAGVKITRYG